MSDLDPYVIDLPIGECRSGDPWRIEFKYDHGRRRIWINNVAEPMAEHVYGEWMNGSGGSLISCVRCPESVDACCPHGVPVWLYSQMIELRIMPMREAV